MKIHFSGAAGALGIGIVALLAAAAGVWAQDGPPPGAPGGGAGFGPGPGGFGGGGPGGPFGNREERKLVKRFDKDGDKRLNATERKAAREAIAKEQAEGGGPRRGPGGFGPRNRGGSRGATPQPGAKVTVADAPTFPDKAFYDPLTLRTLFLEFESADWEKELTEFHNSDVLVPARLTVDGKAYPDVGVHFRGMSSFGMVGEGQKRSLNLSVDFAHEGQNVQGYRTLNLLNSHEDPSFLRAVLFYDIAREYLPAPKANFVRVVINGENWGVYVNVQQFNKDFLRDAFKTTQGVRWKVPGSPGARGSLAYLGDDQASYKGIYELKSKENPKAWADLIRLCKTLNQTPADQLEAALAPILDVDGALRFLALDNALINNDGYWIRTSDYSIYQDEAGKFHVLPQDANETLTKPGGPGFGGGPGGGRGPGGRRQFGPGAMLGQVLLDQGDTSKDQKLSKDEMTALGGTWFDRFDTGKAGKLTAEQFSTGLATVLPVPQGFGGPGLFGALDADQDGSLTRAEATAAFGKWAEEWDTDKSGGLGAEKLSAGLETALPRPNFGGPGGPGGAGGGRAGMGGPPGMMMAMNVKGVELDPLIAANDASKPLISKLLAVPAWRERYLGYVREIAEKHLDWSRLGPAAGRYHALIADAVKADTRKLDPTEDFEKSVDGEAGEGGHITLKAFAEQRRAYLLKQTAALPKPSP